MNKKQNIIALAILGVAFYVLAVKVTGAGFLHVTTAKGLLKLFLGACLFIGGGVLSLGLASHKSDE